jgi:subtilisin family serine protease
VLAGDDDPEAIAAQASSLFGGRVKHVYRHATRGFAIRLSRNAAAALAADPRVLYVEEDGTIEISGMQTAPPWGLDRIDARALPLDGRYTYPTVGTTVYAHVIDTGIRASHVEFGGRAFVAGDYVDDDNDGDAFDVGNDDANPRVPDGADCHGHGTHVAGTIGGVTYGVASLAGGDRRRGPRQHADMATHHVSCRDDVRNPGYHGTRRG